ncbi:hypothetical protein ABPG74_008164 [Tetrahymena malaccensis]
MEQNNNQLPHSYTQIQNLLDNLNQLIEQQPIQQLQVIESLTELDQMIEQIGQQNQNFYGYIKYIIAQFYLQFIDINDVQRNQYENQQNIYQESFEIIKNENDLEQLNDPNPETGRREGRQFFLKMVFRNNRNLISKMGSIVNGLKFLGNKTKQYKDIIRAMTPPLRNAIDSSKEAIKNIPKDGIKKFIETQVNTIAKMTPKQVLISSLKSQFGIFSICLHLGLHIFELYQISKQYIQNKNEEDGLFIQSAKIKLKNQLAALGIKIGATFVAQGGIIVLSAGVGSFIPGIGTIIGTAFGILLSFFANKYISQKIDQIFHEKQIQALQNEASSFFRLSQNSTYDDLNATHRRLRAVYHPDAQGLSEQQRIENRKTLIQIEFYYNILKDRYQ